MQALFDQTTELKELTDATNRVTTTLDAKCEKADIDNIAKNHCSHLDDVEKALLRQLLKKHEPLFDGTLGDWNTRPVSLELLPNAKPHHGKAYPVPKCYEELLKKEVDRLVKLGVLRKCSNSDWASPSFAMPKKNQMIRFLTDLRQVNKRIKRKPFPLPNINDLLQKLEGFTYATTIDLNMGYYHIRLDPQAQDICTLILPGGKYKYQRLPMGLNGAPDIFQDRMSELVYDTNIRMH